MLEGDKLAETPRGEAKWNAQDWRSYLLALAHNTYEKNYCLPYQNFPKEIEPSAAWHETFDAMRRETAADGRERWGLIGTTRTRDRVFISQTFVRAEKDPFVIQGFDIQTATKRAQGKGIQYCVGDIHTHPETRNKLAQLLQGGHQKENEFSAMDLYALLTAGNPLSVMCLIGPSGNQLACRSKESRHVPSYLDQQAFGEVWAKYAQTNEKANLALAKYHRLILYSGKPDQSLKRIVPCPMI